MDRVAPRTPVLAGVGVVAQREEDPRLAQEASALMIEAARRAGADAGAPELLAELDRITVPKGRWDYTNPAGLIARAVGADRATTVRTSVGVLQQSPIGDACRRIADGELDVALVAGGEAGYRLLRARIEEVEVADTLDGDEPDVVLAPTDELRHPVELRAGLQMPIGIYAMIDSAFRTRLGRGFDEHLEQLARVYSRFSEIAAANPDAWQREPVAPETIRSPSDRNRMQAFPYTRLHCSSWSVDQAGALLLCSAGKAEAMGVPRERWVFPLVSTESNFMLWATARAHLGESPGARIAGRAALDHAGLAPDDLDLVDLYSPFPIAVELYAAELGIPLDRDLTVTGGMPFAGGPYNNYVHQSTARMAQLLRAGRGRTGLVSNASGVMTKQAFCVWSTEPGAEPFAVLDVSAEVEREVERRDVVVEYAGAGTVAGCTVLHDRGKPPKAVTIVDTADGRRTAATSEDAAVISLIEQTEFNGRRIEVTSDGSFHV